MPSILPVQSSAAVLDSYDHGRHVRHMQHPHSGGSTVPAVGENTWFRGGLPTPPRTKDMADVSMSSNYGTLATNRPYASSYSGRHAATGHTRVPSDPHPHTRPQSGPSAYQSQETTEKAAAQLIASHLQIPESVNHSKGSLAEFAAEITCLFWFETATTLRYAESLGPDEQTDRGLVRDATPSTGFRKWVTTILSTTQVGKNVILLALMFIYRLKNFNPAVSGKRGSEFRLLTIALMLGNKFLDDNTYTNKTWAEVSGISVTEIHIMEVEFLSNMRYELYASQEEWERWKALLGRFGAFYDKAARFEVPDGVSNPITPSMPTFNYKLPSPPSMHHSTQPPTYHALPNPFSTLPQLPRSPTRQQQPLLNGYPSDRKRSFDSSDVLPPAKRPHLSLNSTPAAMLMPLSQPIPGPINDLSNMPCVGGPNEPAPGVRFPPLPAPRNGTPTAMGTQLAPLNLPVTRAMAGIYPPNAPAWAQPITPMSAVAIGFTGPISNAISPVGDGRGSGVNSARTSPVNLYGPSTPTRAGLSPSHFLTNRSSPYRPVRHVNTLLIPPPSAALQNSVRHIDFSQMHYQPLGRSAEVQTGQMPYLIPDGRAQSTVSTPITQYYRHF